MKATINLTEKEVAEILREHLSPKFASVGEIKLEASTKYVGNQYDGTSVGVFKQATCEVKL